MDNFLIFNFDAGHINEHCKQTYFNSRAKAIEYLKWAVEQYYDKINRLNELIIQKESKRKDKNIIGDIIPDPDGREDIYINREAYAEENDRELLFKSMLYLKNKLKEIESLNKKKEKQILKMEHEKIFWKGSEKELIILIEKLIENKYIEVDWFKRYVFIEEHFINKNGKPFKNTQSSVVKSNPHLNTEKISDFFEEYEKTQHDKSPQ